MQQIQNFYHKYVSHCESISYMSGSQKETSDWKKRIAGEIFHAISLLKTTHNIYFLFSSNKHILIKCTQNQKPHHNVINIWG